MFQSQKEIERKNKSNLIAAKKHLFGFTSSGLKQQIEFGFQDNIFISTMFDLNPRVVVIPIEEEGWWNEDELSGKKVSLYQYNNSVYGTFFVVGSELLLCENEYEDEPNEKAMLKEFTDKFNTLHFFTSLEEAESYIINISTLKIAEYYFTLQKKPVEEFRLTSVNFPSL